MNYETNGTEKERILSREGFILMKLKLLAASSEESSIPNWNFIFYAR